MINEHLQALEQGVDDNLRVVACSKLLQGSGYTPSQPALKPSISPEVNSDFDLLSPMLKEAEMLGNGKDVCSTQFPS